MPKLNKETRECEECGFKVEIPTNAWFFTCPKCKHGNTLEDKRKEMLENVGR